MPRPLPKNWTYIGDVNLRHGGIFYDLSGGFDYVRAVQITDLDSAIGYEGAYLIESGDVYLPDLTERAKWKEILDTCGYTLTEDNAIANCMGGVFPVATPEGLTLACDASIAYMGLQGADMETVVIGTEPADHFQAWSADTRLRGNAKLRNYVYDNYLS